MGDENPIRTLGDYSKPSHEGYRNTIGLPIGNNLVPFRSDTTRLVQNGCSFHGLRSEDPNQHLKDFLKLVDSFDLDGSISTWEDLTTQFLAQFFPPGRTTKLCNNILMFQKHHGESISEAWTRFKDLLQKVPHHGIDLGSKSKFFMIMSPSTLNARLTAPAAANSAIRTPTNLGKSLRTSSSTTMEVEMKQKNSSNWSRPFLHPQGIPKTPDQRLLKLEDQIYFLQKGS
ncbi:zinc finger, CCHC-type containing protein [Tanacetum coccineum]